MTFVGAAPFPGLSARRPEEESFGPLHAVDQTRRFIVMVLESEAVFEMKNGNTVRPSQQAPSP